MADYLNELVGNAWKALTRENDPNRKDNLLDGFEMPMGIFLQQFTDFMGARVAIWGDNDVSQIQFKNAYGERVNDLQRVQANSLRNLIVVCGSIVYDPDDYDFVIDRIVETILYFVTNNGIFFDIEINSAEQESKFKSYANFIRGIVFEVLNVRAESESELPFESFESLFPVRAGQFRRERWRQALLARGYNEGQAMQYVEALTEGGFSEDEGFRYINTLQMTPGDMQNPDSTRMSITDTGEMDPALNPLGSGVFPPNYGAAAPFRPLEEWEIQNLRDQQEGWGEYIIGGAGSKRKPRRKPRRKSKRKISKRKSRKSKRKISKRKSRNSKRKSRK
jgi:hypothetical protein